MAAVIAMSGCAKRNADRELARVLKLLDERCAEVRAAIEAAHGFGVTLEEGMLNALSAFRMDLERGLQRRGEGEPLELWRNKTAGPPLEVTIRVDDSGVREFAAQLASRIGDQVEYLPEVKP